MKKFSLIFMSVLLLSTTVGFSYNVSDGTYQEYFNYVQMGVIDESISYELWKELKNLSTELEKGLSESEDFHLVYDSRNEDSNRATTSFSMKKGDILITNGTAVGGLTGHAGIAISATQILHIAGYNETPKLISLSSWNNKYSYINLGSWTRIYRHSNTTTATQAGTWAYNTYYNSGATYVISDNWARTDVTYCSKIVWQAYYYGPSNHCATIPASNVVLPYNLPDLIHNVSYAYLYSS